MQIATDECCMEGKKAAKPTPLDNVCDGEIGHFTSWLTMGYVVAARGRSRASLLIQDNSQGCIQCLKIIGKHVPLGLPHPMVVM